MTVPARPIAVDLFCGAGGLSLGFEQAGFDVVAAFDSDPIQVATYATNFPAAYVGLADLATSTGEYLRQRAGLDGTQIHAVIGGPPCQGFSLIGKRNPCDPRNELLIHFARLISELSPLYFAFENVPGLLSGEARLVLASFLQIVRRAGYAVVLPTRVLDASDFGVPQRRPRLFVIGYKRGLPKPSYPLTLRDPRDVYRPPTVLDAIGDLPKVQSYRHLLVTDIWHRRLGKPSSYAALLRGDIPDPSDRSNPRTRNDQGLTGCGRTQHSAQSVRRFARTDPGTHEPVSRFFRLPPDGLARTIRAGTGPAHGSFTAPRPIHPLEPRCITVREGARLQSFPDWFDFHSTKWHAFMQIGNSVPPMLARALARQLIAAIDGNDELLLLTEVHHHARRR